MPAPYNPLNIKKYDPFLRPIPLLPDPDSGQQVCMMLNEEWIGALIGALWPLRYTDKWQGTPEERVLGTQRTELLIYMLQVAAAECGDSSMAIDDIRIENCFLQISYAATPGSWVTVGNIRDCASSSDRLLKYGSGPDVNDVEIFNFPANPAPGEINQLAVNYACNLAMEMAMYLRREFHQIIDEATAWIDAGNVVLDLASDFLPSVTGLIATKIGAFAADFAANDMQEVKRLTNEDFAEDRACDVLCEIRDRLLRNQGDWKIEDTDAIMEDMAETSADLPPGGPLITVYGQSFALFLKAFDRSNVHRRTAVWATSPGNDCSMCDECTTPIDWCETFLDGAGLKSLGVIWGVYNSAADRVDQSVFQNYGYSAAAVIYVFDQPVIVTRGSMDVQAPIKKVPYIQMFNEAGQIVVGSSTEQRPAGDLSLSLENESLTPIKSIGFYLDAKTSSCSITRIEICGLGDNPFG